MKTTEDALHSAGLQKKGSSMQWKTINKCVAALDRFSIDCSAMSRVFVSPYYSMLFNIVQILVIWFCTAARAICIPSLQKQYIVKWLRLSVNLHLMSANEWKPINTRFEMNSYTEILRYHYVSADSSINERRQSCGFFLCSSRCNKIPVQTVPIHTASKYRSLSHNSKSPPGHQRPSSWHVSASAAWQMCRDSLGRNEEGQEVEMDFISSSFWNVIDSEPTVDYCDPAR